MGLLKVILIQQILHLCLLLRGTSCQPGQKLAEDQVFELPIISDTTLVRSNPNKVSSASETLELKGGLSRDNKRALLSFNATGILNTRDYIPQATLTLTLNKDSRRQFGKVVANGAFIKGGRIDNPVDVNSSSWSCESDLKPSNLFAECKDGIEWEGGIFSPSSHSSVFVRSQDKVEIDVTNELRKGANAILLTSDHVFTSLDFNSIESDSPPKLEVKVPKIGDTILNFPENTESCKWYPQTVNINNNGNKDFTLSLIRCHSKSFRPQYNFVFTIGVPWSIASAHGLANTEEMEKLREKGDVYFVPLWCKDGSSCYENSTNFEYGVVSPSGNEAEADIYEKVLISKLNLDNIVAFTYDRISPSIQEIHRRNPERFQAIHYHDGWFSALICGPERKQLGPSDPDFCTDLGWVQSNGISSACSFTIDVGGQKKCVDFQPVDYITDILSRSSDVGRCLADSVVAPEDGKFPNGKTYKKGDRFETGIWYNPEFINPRNLTSFRLRKWCYELGGNQWPNGIPVSAVEIGGNQTTPGQVFAFTAFTFGYSRPLAQSEAIAYTREFNSWPLGSLNRTMQAVYPIGIPREKVPPAGTFSTTEGRTPYDTNIAKLFRDYIQFVKNLKTSDAKIEVTDFNTAGPFVAGQGQAVLPIPNLKDLYRTDLFPQLGASIAKNNPGPGHNAIANNPKWVSHTVLKLVEDVVEARE